MDIAALADDHAEMERWAEEAGTPFYRKVLANLRQNPMGRRIRLPFPRAIQKHEACLPTSLASALATLGEDLDPDVMASEITFGGTHHEVKRGGEDRLARLFRRYTASRRFFTMEHPDKVAKLILDAGFWKGTAEFREFNKKRIENRGQPLPRYRPTTEEDFRGEFIPGQVGEDVVEASVNVGLKIDPQRPNVFVEWTKLPILDPARITVPTMIIHGEKDFAAKEEDLLPFYSQLNTT